PRVVLGQRRLRQGPRRARSSDCVAAPGRVVAGGAGLACARGRVACVNSISKTGGSCHASQTPDDDNCCLTRYRMVHTKRPYRASCPRERLLSDATRCKAPGSHSIPARLFSSAARSSRLEGAEAASLCCSRGVVERVEKQVLLGRWLISG